jgi:2-methylisocitrate lyase-like PEP mutase family enzyme
MARNEMTAESVSRRLKDRIFDVDRPPLVLPGVPTALAARIVQDVGFEALYVSGAGVANTVLGMPDIGFLGLSDVLHQVELIRSAVSLPIVVDADTGYGNAVNAYRTVQSLERAGANGVQLEDQRFPKRCGHFAHKEVIPVAEMVAKIQAAADARADECFVIVGRTDALAVEGFDAACERAQRYLDAGADVAFVEAPRSREDFLSLPGRLNAPMLANVVEGGMTPVLPFADLAAAGYRVLLYANSAMRAAMSGMQMVLRNLHAHGDTMSVTHAIAAWEERQRLVGKGFFDSLESRYGAVEEGGQS